MSLAEEITTRKLPDDFSMLEIGVGSYPFEPDPTVIMLDRAVAVAVTGNKELVWNQAFNFSGSRSYLGVDNGTVDGLYEYPQLPLELESPQQRLSKAKRKLDEMACLIQEHRKDENISFRFGNVLGLSLPEDAYQEVMMSNVLSSNIEERQIQDLLDLSANVLVAGGMLVARETFTPHMLSPVKLNDLLKGVGFEPIEIIIQRDKPKVYEELIEYYGQTLWDVVSWPGRILDPERYYSLAIKP